MSDRPVYASPPVVELVRAAYTRANGSPLRPPEESGPPAAARGAPPARTWSQVVDELRALRDLTDDWDGQGALAPPPALVDGAIRLAQDLQANRAPVADFAIAGVNGTIFFEWHDPGDFVEVEVTAPDKAEVHSVRRGTGAVEVFTLARHA